MKDDMETECMNELFGNTRKPVDDDDNLETPEYHWRPVAKRDIDSMKIISTKIERNKNEI